MSLDSNRFQIKSGDTNTPLRIQVSNSDGKVDLTGCTVRFLMTDWNKEEILIDDVASIEYAKEGIVRYDFIDGQTDNKGDYLCEFEILFPNGNKETFPTIGQLILTVNKSLRDSIPSRDTTPPEDISNLIVSSVSQESISLSWIASPSTDVKGYNVYRDGNLLTTTTSTSCSIIGLSPNTTYMLTVKAKDFANNLSSGISISAKTTSDVTNNVIDGGNFTNIVFDTVIDGGSFLTAPDETIDGGTF